MELITKVKRKMKQMSRGAFFLMSHKALNYVHLSKCCSWQHRRYTCSPNLRTEAKIGTHDDEMKGGGRGDLIVKRSVESF